MMRKLRDSRDKTKFTPALMLMVVLTLYVMPELKAQNDDSVASLLEDYAYNMLYVADVDARREQLNLLIRQAERIHEIHHSPASFYLLARLTYGYSTTQGMFGMRRSLQQARSYLEQALAMDESALNGQPKALLGYLYAGLPPWPVGFGDKDLGQKLLNEAMVLDAKDININYYFAAIYLRDKDYLSAQAQLRKAKSLAVSDSATPLMQTLLLREIDSNLAALDERLR